MFIAHCLYFVVFTIQLFTSMCHPNHCIHLLPSERNVCYHFRARGHTRELIVYKFKLMTSLVW